MKKKKMMHKRDKFTIVQLNVVKFCERFTFVISYFKVNFISLIQFI